MLSCQFTSINISAGAAEGEMFELSEAMRGFTGLTVVTVVFLAAGAALILANRTVDRGARNVFLACLAALACIALADWFSFVTEGVVAELRLVHAFIMAATFAVAPALPIALANTICLRRRAHWVECLLLVNAAIEFASIAGGFVFWVDADNVYHRGQFYIVYVAMYTISAVYLVVKTFMAARVYQNSNIAAVFGIITCMFVGVVIQLLDSTVRMTWPAASMAIILYFMFYSDMVLRTDALTKLLNRRSFEEVLDHPSLPCVAVVIDIDDFKYVNDTYGHAFGDECLARVAQMIRSSFGSAGLCYRTGGDEFAVIMRKHFADADAFSSKLMRMTIDAKSEDERMPSVSVGYAAANADCVDINKVFDRADQNMYQAKRSRKGR